MSTDTGPESSFGLETTEDCVNAIERLRMPDAALERFLESRDYSDRMPKRGEHFYTRVAEVLSEEDLRDLIRQHKYAGRQTVNYFLIKGISNQSLDEISENASQRLPDKEMVNRAAKEPFLAQAEQFGDRLYLAVGYYENAGSENPVTGKKEDIKITQRTVMVIYDDMDLVEIRGSDTPMIETVRDEVCKTLGKYRDSVKTRPNLGIEFQKEFNERIESYYNIKVKVDDDEDTALDTIAFTSKKNSSGERQDARESKRVERELSEEDSEITMGYVKTNEGLRFRINRDKAKLSFRKSEREENLNGITKVIDEVLREAGEYSQGELSGIDDVPE